MASTTTTTTTLADILRLPSALRALDCDAPSAARAACACRAVRDAVCSDEHYWCAALGADFGATDEGAPLAPSALAGAPPEPPEPPAWRRRTAATPEQKEEAPPPPSSPPFNCWHRAYGRWARAFPRGLPGPCLARAVRAWRRLERWLAREGATHVLASLRPGATAASLALAAELLGVERLPHGLAALYSVHDGQACPVGWMAALAAYDRDRPGARHPPPLRRRLEALRRLHLASFPSRASLPPGFDEAAFYGAFAAHRCREARAAEVARRQRWLEQQQQQQQADPPPPPPLAWEAAVVPHLARRAPGGGGGSAGSAAMQFEGRAGLLGGYRAYDRSPVQHLRPLHQLVPSALALMAEVGGGDDGGGRGQQQQGNKQQGKQPPPIFAGFASAAYADRYTLVCVRGGGGGGGGVQQQQQQQAAGGGQGQGGGGGQQPQPQPGDVFVVPANWRRLPPAHAQAALLRAHPPRSGAEGEDGVLSWFEEFVARCERGEYAFATTPTGGYYEEEEEEEQEGQQQEEQQGATPLAPLPPLAPPLPAPYWPPAFDEDRGNLEDAVDEDGLPAAPPAFLGAQPPPRGSLAELGRYYGLRSDAPAPCGALSTLALPPGALAAEATTRGVRVRVSAALMPEECSSDQTNFCYCLRLFMPEGDPECYVEMPPAHAGSGGGGFAGRGRNAATKRAVAARRVQLISRSWRMLDAHGRLIDTASGPGVIGKHPVLWPGGAGEFSYVSQTATPGGPVAAAEAAAAAAAAAATTAAGGGGTASEPTAGALAVPHPEGACCGYMEGTLTFAEMPPFPVGGEGDDALPPLPAAVAAAGPLQAPLPVGQQFEVAVPRFALVVPRFVF